MDLPENPNLNSQLLFVLACDRKTEYISHATWLEISSAIIHTNHELDDRFLKRLKTRFKETWNCMKREIVTKNFMNFFLFFF